VRQRVHTTWLRILTGLSAVIYAVPAMASGGDHWSIFSNILPESLQENLHVVWGKTWIAGDAHPDRIMHLVMSVLVFVLAILCTTMAARKFKKAGTEAVMPEKKFGLFTVLELCSEAFLGIMKDAMGPKHARKFFPLIMSLAIFILLGNLLGMIPGLLPATDNLNTTLALGLVVFIVTHFYGIKEHGFVHYFAHFLGPIRAWYALPLMLLMLLIEVISHLARPLSLGIRLFGNMIGDHKVLGIFLSFGIVLLPLPVMVLGLLVSVVQTLVFCLLSVVYIALAVAEADEH